jgi:hypothetical protein
LFGITPMAITAPVIEPQSTFTGFGHGSNGGKKKYQVPLQSKKSKNC